MEVQNNKPMRVLQVVTTMNRGGLETMLMNYYRHIDRDVLQFDFLEHRQERSDYDDEIEALGGHIYRLPVLNPVSPSYHKALKDFFQEHHYTVVHSHLDCLSAIPLKAAKEAGIPVRIAHAHNSAQDHNWKYILKLHYKKQIPTYATKLYACGKEAGEWMFDGAPFEVFPNAIDTAEFAYNEEVRNQVRRELGIEDAFVVGHVGRFFPQKNHPFLLEVFSEVCKLNSRAVLLLVGDGEGRAAAEQQAKELGIADRVKFLGVRSDVNRLLQAMDVFVLPSLYEGFGIVSIEAQCSGLPCVVSDMVSTDSSLTDGVMICSLSDSTKVWAQKICSPCNIKREEQSGIVSKAGYDIVKKAITLQNFYLNIGV